MPLTSSQCCICAEAQVVELPLKEGLALLDAASGGANRGGPRVLGQRPAAIGTVGVGEAGDAGRLLRPLMDVRERQLRHRHAVPFFERRTRGDTFRSRLPAFNRASEITP